MADLVLTLIDPEVERLRLNKLSGYNYRERRADDWNENYTLYRDKVAYNRLTQRQTVNIPLMKQTIRTLLKDVDDMPVLYFENLDNDKQAEVLQNEHWNKTVEYNRLEIQDIIDKKQDMFFGRTFDQMQIMDGMVKIDIIDPEDILVDRYMNPHDIDSARFLIHTHIFVPLSVLEQNEDYDKKKVKQLKKWHLTDEGLKKQASNQQSLIDKSQKMADLGVQDVESPILGETYIELSLHFLYDKKKGSDDEEYFLKVEADDFNILMDKPLEEVIGKTEDNYWRTHLPYNSWADDVDKQDVWTDGIADICRTPNKILNTWFSQLVENRTLRSFGMHYYNSNLEGFAPNTYTPIAWGWYPIPVPVGGTINDVMQKVDIPDLSESLDEMKYVQEMSEKATGATTTQQGAQTERKTTLGEVELALGEAKERVKGMSKFYTQVWKDRAHKYLKLIEAAPEKLDTITIHKKGKNTDNMFTREISPKDFMTKKGYTYKVWSQDEKKAKDSDSLEKLNVAVMNMPGNPKLLDVYQRKLLEFSDLSPEEINAIMDFEQQRREALASTAGGAPMGVGGAPNLAPIAQQQPQGQPQQVNKPI